MPRKGSKFPKRPFGDPDDRHGFGFLVPSFFEWMRVQNYSDKTIENREKYILYFVQWCAERGVTRPSEVTKALLERYQRWIYHYRNPKSGEAMSTRSQHSRLVPVRAFFKWTARMNHTLYNPASELELPRLEKRLPKHVLTISEVEAVFAAVDLGEALGVRDRAILETFYSTGMRRMELAGLKLHDIDGERGTIMIRQGKGKKDRMIPIGGRALAWIHRYVEEVRPNLVIEPDAGVLFLTNLNEPFTPNRLTQLVREAVDKAELGKRGACHLFRHTCATLMLENGADVRYIQEMLGHARLDTTQIYTQVSIRRLKEVHELTHPAKLRPNANLSNNAETNNSAGKPD